MDESKTKEVNISEDFTDSLSFMEVQFPVAKVSMESYKERKAVSGQTITGLGKWWGRKPLILVRAALLGLLMPASSNPIKDREIFLKILTMDNEGLWQRKYKNIPNRRLLNELETLPPSIRERFLDYGHGEKRKIRTTLSKKQKNELQQIVFNRMPYSEKLSFCCRPEQVSDVDFIDWDEINDHLGTNAKNISDLIPQLGKKKFSRIVRVGDAFSGGGSIPFEAARLGCDVHGSDLNPTASLLTWASININGGTSETKERTLRVQQEIYRIVDNIVSEWEIEHNSLGWRADSYLYCVEVVSPETGWKVPLAPSWAIAPKTRVIALLEPDELARRFDLEILENVTKEQYSDAKNRGTVAR